MTAPTSPTTPATRNEPLVLDALRLGSNDRIELFMFGDTSLIARSQFPPGVDRPGGAPLAFSLGELGLQVTAHLAPGLVGRMEAAISYNDGYGTDIDLERVYIEYRKKGYVVAAGRTHTELGYWNNAFHHGRWLQLTINRPRVLRFEDSGGMLPVHHIGVTFERTPERGESGIEAVVAVGNGHGPTQLGIQTNGDDNIAKSLLLRIGGVGYAHDTLRFGVNAMIDKIRGETFINAAGNEVPVYPLLGLETGASPTASMTELITGAYLALRAEDLEVFSEVYNVLHTGGGKSWDTTDGFVVAGLRFGSWIPYAQFEARYGDGGTDPFYNSDPEFAAEAGAPTNFVEGILGLHYDLSAWSALKLELGARQLGSGQTGFMGMGANQGPDIPLKNGQDDYRVEINWSFGR